MNMRNWSSRSRLLWEAPGDPAPGGTPASDPPPDPAPQAEAVDLSFIPETFHVDGKPDLDKFKEHYGKLVEPSVAPDSYEYVVPADMDFTSLGVPEGITLDFDLQDPAMQPLLGELTETLKGIGAPAEMGGKIGGLLAKYEASKLGAAMEAQKQEFAKLGTPDQANQRIAAVVRAMETRLSAEEAQALQGATRSAPAMMALEKLLGPRNSTTPTPTPEEQADDGGLSSRYPTSRTK